MSRLLEEEEEDDFYKNTYGGFDDDDDDNEFTVKYVVNVMHFQVKLSLTSVFMLS